MPRKQRRLRLKLIDVWSMPHFLFGTVAALTLLGFDLPLREGLLATILGALIWEYFEIKIGIRETPWNIVSDVLMPILAFGLIVILVPREIGGSTHATALLVIAFLLFAYFNYVAWQARSYQARSFLG